MGCPKITQSMCGLPTRNHAHGLAWDSLLGLGHVEGVGFVLGFELRTGGTEGSVSVLIVFSVLRCLVVCFFFLFGLSC